MAVIVTVLGVNLGPTAQTATLIGQLAGGSELRLAVTPPRGPTTLLRVRGVRGVVAEPLFLAPGMNEVAIAGQAGAQLVAPTVLDAAFAPFAGSSPPAMAVRPGIIGPPCLRVAVAG